MRNRNNQVILRLSDKEYEYFKKQVEVSGLSMNVYMIHLITGYKIKERRPQDYGKLAYELSRIGNNINQIAYKANATNSVGKDDAEAALLLVKKCVRMLRNI